MATNRQPAATTFDLAELRDAAEHDGESATTVYIGGPGWEVVRALVAVVDAANALTMVEIPKVRGKLPQQWYPAMDELLAALDRFENRGNE